MAFRKISELSSSLTPSGSGIIPIVINGTTFGTTLDAIKDQINSVLTPQYASSSITSSVDTLIGNVSSLNTFTSSADSRLDSMEIFTGSLNDYYATDQELLELREYFNTYSSSNNTVNTQQNIRLDALDGLEIATGSLLTQIETEKGRIDAILLSSDADKDSFKEIVDLINSVDTENDNAFGTYVLNTNDRIDSLEIESGSSSSRLNKIESVSGSWITIGDLPPQPTPNPTQSPVDLSLIVGRLDKLEIESGSIRDEFNSFTSSYLIVSQSFNDRISTLEGYHIPEPTSTPTATPNPTPTSTIAPTPNATPVPTVEPDPTPTPTTDYTLFTYMIVWRRNTVANGMLYDFTRLDGNTNDYFYSNEQIKCIYETFGNGGGNFWNIAVGDNSEGLISVGDNSWNNVSLSDINVISPFSNTTRAVWNDANDRMGNGPQHYIITFVSGEVTELVSFDSIGDVSGCTPYTDPAPTSTPNATPNPTATVAPPSPTSTVAPISCISSAPLNINVESEYDSNSNTTTFKYITSDLDGNGGLFGCINVDRGSTVTINVTGSAPNLETHPIKITNFNGLDQHEAPLPNVVSTWNAGDPYTLTWEVPCDVGITQYQYQCVNHAGMRGVINVSGTCPTPTPSPTSTPNATPNPTPTETPNSTPEPEPTLCLTSVNSIQINDGKYKFNGSAYGPYGVNVGTYVIENVPGAHPIAFLNNGKESLITYSGEIANGSKDGLDGNNYTFYSGDVTVNVIGDFDTLSYECYYHGYMGGENNLVFDGTLCNPIPTATPNPIPTATPNPTPSNNTIYVHTP